MISAHSFEQAFGGMISPAPELKDCPHCGVKPQVVLWVKPDRYFVECANGIDCKVWPMTEKFPTEAQALKAWETDQVHPIRG